MFTQTTVTSCVSQWRTHRRNKNKQTNKQSVLKRGQASNTVDSINGWLMTPVRKHRTAKMLLPLFALHCCTVWLCKSQSYFFFQVAWLDANGHFSHSPISRLLLVFSTPPSKTLVRVSTSKVALRLSLTISGFMAPDWEVLRCDQVKWHLSGERTTGLSFRRQPAMAFWFAQPQSDSKWTWPASRDLRHPEAAQARKRRFKTCYPGAPSAAQVVPNNRFSHKRSRKYYIRKSVK